VYQPLKYLGADRESQTMKIKSNLNPVTLVGSGAWVLALTTLSILAWFFVALIVEPHGVCRTWSTGTWPELTGAFGLTYDGGSGQLLAGGQIVFVLLSLWMSTRGVPLIRRLGHVGLIGWAGLWVGNAIWFMALAPMPVTRTVAWVLALLFGCTVLRAVFNWNGKHVPHAHLLHPGRARTFGM
jgi:hypothetical protein